MITGVIQSNGGHGTLVVTLPCRMYELQEHLACIGITSEAAKLPVNGTENIKVELEADEPIGELVLSKLTRKDTLFGLNHACLEIRKNCPYGYGEFMDMFCSEDNTQRNRFSFYRKYCTTPPSTANGTKYLIEEANRYRITMENYICACKAAEEEEQVPEEEEWEI